MTVTIAPVVIDAEAALEPIEADVEAHAMAASTPTDRVLGESVTLPAVTPVPSPTKDAASPAPLLQFAPVPAGV